jgi:hypothetical protein
MNFRNPEVYAHPPTLLPVGKGDEDGNLGILDIFVPLNA